MDTGPIPETLTRIETPENVWLTLRLAGPGTRLGAYTIDLLIRFGILFAVAQLAGGLAAVVGPSAPLGVLLVGMFLVEWGYGTLFEAWTGGRTPGKRALGLRVVKAGGYPIGFYDAMLRNLLRAADILPLLYGVGLITMFTNRRLQRLGDLAAGTVVVRERRERLREGLGFLRRVEPLEPSSMRRGFRPSERTLELIELLFHRRRRLPPARLDEIAAILAKPLADRLGYEGAERSHETAPGRFLIRVLKTFGDGSSAEEAR